MIYFKCKLASKLTILQFSAFGHPRNISKWMQAFLKNTPISLLSGIPIWHR